ncbi:MAG: hypothetical protein AB1774_03930 [Bacillota bacterium]
MNKSTFNLSPLRMAHLVDNLPGVFRRVADEIEQFTSFIETRGRAE